MTDSILNVNTLDPFAEDDAQVDTLKTQAPSQIHIRVQQRSGRKKLTTVQGLPPEVNFKKVLKVFKKNFCCNGTVVEDAELGKVIQLQGDQRKAIYTFLIEEELATDDQIKVHGG